CQEVCRSLSCFWLRYIRSLFFFSSRRRHTRWPRDWSSDVCSSDLGRIFSRPPIVQIVAVRLVFGARCHGFRRQLGPPAPWPAFEEMAVVEETVEHGGHGRAVAEQFPPVLYGSVRSDQCARALVTAHDDLTGHFE